MPLAARALVISCYVGVAAYVSSPDCEGAEPPTPWPLEAKREAVNGCKQSNIDGAVASYKKRANVNELPPETITQIAEATELPALALCSCLINEIAKNTSLDTFSSRPDEARMKFFAAMSGPCVGYTPSKWKVYVPEGSARHGNERVSLAKVNFVESDEVLAANTSTQDVLSYIERARQATAAAFVSYPGGVALTVGFNCDVDKCSVSLARNQGDALQRHINDLRARLAALTPPKVSGPVAFYAYFQIGPQ